MKKRFIYSSLLIASSFLASCTKDFTEINTDPNKTTAELFNANFLLAQSQIKFSNTGYDQLLFQSMWSQALASTYDYYGNGDKYVFRGSGQGYNGRVWDTSYGAATLVFEMKNLVKGNAAQSNLDNVGTIMKVLTLSRVTDAYGDVPYSEAGLAKEGLVTPVYDTQKSIYASMLSELETATAALDATKAKPSSDLFYSGDIPKWKKLGYSLMLRLAMRLTKVDPATAKTYAEKAFQGGTMADITDNAKVQPDNANGNGSSNAAALLVNDDFREVRWSKTLIDFMALSADPRISAIAEVSTGTGKKATENQAPGITTASLQKGLPNGYDLNGGATDVSRAPGYPGTSPANPATTGDAAAPVGLYSRPRFAVYDDRNSINMLLTYGETELLLAEAATRGWATGDAATHYANALAANMRSLAQLNAVAVATVDEAAITAYVAAHPLLPGTALEQINMEYWVETASTFNFNENWTNWRRSGFPVLTPVVYSGQFTNGTIPRRIQYKLNVGSSNTANFNAAVARLSGGDTFTSRMYWDVAQ